MAGEPRLLGGHSPTLQSPTETAEPANFFLQDVFYPEEVDAGDAFHIELSMVNIGAKAGTADISISGHDPSRWFDFKKTVDPELDPVEAKSIEIGPIIIVGQTRAIFNIEPFSEEFEIRITPDSDPFLADGAHRTAYYGSLNGPNAYHHEGVTYFAYHGAGENHLDPLIVAYNHESESVIGPVRVGSNPLKKKETLDTHGNPALIVDDSGYVHVIYGGHANWGGHQRHAMTTTPGDIRNWTHLENIPETTTYPQLIKLDDGTIFLFQRGPSEEGGHQADWTYQVSTDHGQTFANPIPFMVGWGGSGSVHTDGKYGEEWGDSWYLRIHRSFGPGPPITITGIYHTCGYTNGSQNRNENIRTGKEWWSRYNQYHVRVDRDGKFSAVDGTDVTDELPLTKSTADKHLFVLDTDIQNCMGGAHLGHSASGIPHLSFGLGNPGDDRRPQKYVNWSGDDWQVRDAPLSGPMEVREEETLLRAGHRMYRSTDGGKSWTRRKTANSPIGRQDYVRNPHPDARYHSVERRSTDDETHRVALFGDSGFVG